MRASAASIVKEVTDTFARMITAIDEKDAGARENYYSREEFVSAVAGGDCFGRRGDWVKAITSCFAERDSQHLEPREVQAIPLAADAALLTSQDTVDMQLKGGERPRYRHAFTMIWKKGPVGWRIMHSHESWVEDSIG